ncbi:MAG TPA: DUF1499 domain-containing protein [Gammaproteobacteria bacterium]|nr:DUF1499 domain-containing protein [Gammaproteobacteria bacterium]
MTLLKIIIFALVLVIAVTFFSLYRNNANLFDAPGPVARLQVFLTSNAAKTSDDHEFKELRTPLFDMNAEELDRRVLGAAADLGWEVLSHDVENQSANFVVYSPVFLFEDDVFVQVQYIDQDRSSLYVESHSRKGRADFAANSDHIQALIKKLR